MPGASNLPPLPRYVFLVLSCDLLFQLIDAKSTDVKSNLLSYLVNTFDKQKDPWVREILDFAEDLPHCEAASRIALPSVLGEMNTLTKEFAEVDTIVTEMEKTTKSDKFQKKMVVWIIGKED